MPITQVFETTVASTGRNLILFCVEDSSDSARVVLHGDRDKLVFEGEVAKARRVFAEEVARYEARVDEPVME